MVIDTSALVAIARGEPERERFLDRLAETPAPLVTAVTWMETRMVILSRSGDPGLVTLDDLVAAANIEIVAVTAALADAAFAAFRRFGKGRHSAGLNFGDCFSYALAKAANAPLLFKGMDFSRTDVLPAVPAS